MHPSPCRGAARIDHVSEGEPPPVRHCSPISPRETARWYSNVVEEKKGLSCLLEPTWSHDGSCIVTSSPLTQALAKKKKNDMITDVGEEEKRGEGIDGQEVFLIPACKLALIGDGDEDVDDALNLKDVAGAGDGCSYEDLDSENSSVFERRGGEDDTAGLPEESHNAGGHENHPMKERCARKSLDDGLASTVELLQRQVLVLQASGERTEAARADMERSYRNLQEEMQDLQSKLALAEERVRQVEEADEHPLANSQKLMNRTNELESKLFKALRKMEELQSRASVQKKEHAVNSATTEKLYEHISNLQGRLESMNNRSRHQDEALRKERIQCELLRREIEARDRELAELSECIQKADSPETLLAVAKRKLHDVKGSDSALIRIIEIIDCVVRAAEEVVDGKIKCLESLNSQLQESRHRRSSTIDEPSASIRQNQVSNDDSVQIKCPSPIIHVKDGRDGDTITTSVGTDSGSDALLSKGLEDAKAWSLGNIRDLESGFKSQEAEGIDVNYYAERMKYILSRYVQWFNSVSMAAQAKLWNNKSKRQTMKLRSRSQAMLMLIVCTIVILQLFSFRHFF